MLILKVNFYNWSVGYEQGKGTSPLLAPQTWKLLVKIVSWQIFNFCLSVLGIMIANPANPDIFDIK